MPFEIEAKLRVPASARAAVRAEMRAADGTLRRVGLAARYYDTADRRLAREGLAWRVRREGRRWVQTLKAPAGGAGLQRFEHEVVVSQPVPDASLHAATAPGRRLLDLIEDARAAGQPVTERYRVEVRRALRRVRTRGAQVELAFDEGWIVAGEQRLRVCELEFERLSGDVAAMLALAGRWCARHGLWLDMTSKAERGDRLAGCEPTSPAGPSAERAPPRRSEDPRYAPDAAAPEAFGAVVDECLAQIMCNAAGLCEGHAAPQAEQVERVHQLRVGIRRLRSALRCFEGWIEPPPDEAVAGLRHLFAELGRLRDDDVSSGPLAAAMAADGAPDWPGPPPPCGVGAPELLRGAAAQRTLLSWLAWRASGPREVAPASAPLVRQVERRLARWHRRLRDAAGPEVFDRLDEPALHDLRKRVKRQRYAIEFFAPLLGRRRVRACLDALALVQERMGAFNDLLSARDRLRALEPTGPGAWFALGWLAARQTEARAAIGPALRRLARCEAPRASRRARAADGRLAPLSSANTPAARRSARRPRPG